MIWRIKMQGRVQLKDSICFKWVQIGSRKLDPNPLSLDSGCYVNQGRWGKPQNSVLNFVCAHQPTIVALGAKKEYKGKHFLESLLYYCLILLWMTNDLV